MTVDKETQVEELVEAHPEVAGWMTRRGMRCVVCGEPFWGTLEELASDSNLEEKELEKFLVDLNAKLRGEDNG